MRRLSGLIRSQSGIAAIEFAFVAPLVILFLIAVIDIGRYFWTKANVQYAVSEAARWTYANINYDDVWLAETTAQKCVKDALTTYLSNLDAALAGQATDPTFTITSTGKRTATATISVSYTYAPIFGGEFRKWWDGTEWTITTSSSAVTPVQDNDALKDRCK